MEESTNHQARLIQFLKDDLSVPTAAISLALRQQSQASDLLPMILWQYGLITTEQLDRVFDWMEAA